ncbi:hypothetical protein ADL19_03965 [Streptomyces purpurogeneiscleroticus]|nr:hypothetical protein ADL19_03965 [Streptomyces purpurogeneiscleroticus]
MTYRLPKPGSDRTPDPALYADFLEALGRVIERDISVTVHGYRISPPKRAGSYALSIEVPRTVRDRSTGELAYVVGVRGANMYRPAHVASGLALDLAADRERRARMLAEDGRAVLDGKGTPTPGGS